MEEVYNFIKKDIELKSDDVIVIGVSGGPDSMCLLDSLYCLKEKLGIEIFVAHINHMIREEADEETEYVKEYCKNKNIKLIRIPYYEYNNIFNILSNMAIPSQASEETPRRCND